MKRRLLRTIAVFMMIALFVPAFPVEIQPRSAQADENLPEALPTPIEVPVVVPEEPVYDDGPTPSPTIVIPTLPIVRPSFGIPPVTTSAPTATPKPTATPRPTATPKPTSAPTPVPANKKITLNLSAITIGKGQSVKTIKAQAENGAAVTWESKNPEIASVNQKGKITGVKKGTATISLSAPGCKSAEVKVTVVGKNKGVQRITLPSSFSMQRTKTKQLRVAFSPSKPKDKTVTWSSSDKNIVSVDSTGLVTAQKIGSATITAVSSSGKQDTVTITVKPLKVKKISISGSASMKAKETQTLTASVTPVDADNKAVKWSSSNKKVAAVDQNGVVTAKKKGTVIITATAKDGSGKKASFTIKVKKADPDPADYGFYYAIYDGEAYITEGKRGYEKVVIPDKIEGYPVTTIEQFAFQNFTELKSVSLPKTLTTIDQWAFSGSGLKSVTIPGGVLETGYGSFADCTSLKTLTVCEGVKAIDTQSFYSCTALISVTLPSTVEIIYDSAFCYCDSLEAIVLPDSVKEVKANAFDGCGNLKYLTAGGLETIGESAFIHCSLENLKLPKVKTIGITAFAGMLSLKKVTFGNSINHIGEGAFSYCRELGRTFLPPSITYINQFAFDECWNFIPVVEAGSYPHQWAERNGWYYELK